MHGIFSVPRVIFVPKLDYAGVWPEMSWDANGRESTKGAEDIVKIRVSKAYREMLNQSRKCRRRRKRGRRICRRIRR